MHPTRNHFLPPDPDAFKQARPSHGRVIVIAPTRAACETIELALHLTNVDTVLEREHGAELREWALGGQGFGIVAGTGTGKTLGIRPVAESILGESLRVGVVNREREATPETPTWNVVIVTTGIARRWFQDDLIGTRDTVVVDEIHQTSAELELCLALGKRAGVRFIWLSATVDPAFYAKYLDSANVLVTEAFDPALRARVKVESKQAEEFFDERFMRHLLQQKRGVAVFVPTRREVEQLAADLGARYPKLNAAFYHGGEPIRVIRQFLEGEAQKPFLLAMTAAGQSAINVRGLDTVVIYDARYGNVVERGRNVLHRLYLGANEILQMAGRVHGRVANGEVYILSDRRMVFEELVPGPPEFQLAGDAERVAITCASIGVDAADLDLPVPLDKTAYRRAMDVLLDRGLIKDGRLTPYGREVEAMPVERPWGELLVRADPELVPLVATAANIDSLAPDDAGGARTARARRQRKRPPDGGQCVRRGGQPARLPGGSVWVAEAPLRGRPRPNGPRSAACSSSRWKTPPSAWRRCTGRWSCRSPRRCRTRPRSCAPGFIELVARVMPFDLVIDEHTVDGTEARISRTSMAGSWGAVAGTLRFFGDRQGVPRAGIEGTTIPYDLVRQNARKGPPVVSVAGPEEAPAPGGGPPPHLLRLRAGNGGGRASGRGAGGAPGVGTRRARRGAGVRRHAASRPGASPAGAHRTGRALAALGWDAGAGRHAGAPVTHPVGAGAGEQLAGVPGHAGGHRCGRAGGRRHAGTAARAALHGASPRRRGPARLRGARRGAGGGRCGCARGSCGG